MWVIVRDRFQAAAYRQALAGAEITLGVEVATFRDLCREILQRDGVEAPVAEDAALGLVIRQVLDALAAAGELRHFARVQAAPGFAAALCESIAELKTALVTPDQLRLAARARQDPALEEIALIYAAYQQRLDSTGWVDSAGLNGLGLEVLQANPGLLNDWSLVVVDGFRTRSARSSGAHSRLWRPSRPSCGSLYPARLGWSASPTAALPGLSTSCNR